MLSLLHDELDWRQLALNKRNSRPELNQQNDEIVATSSRARLSVETENAVSADVVGPTIRSES